MGDKQAEDLIVLDLRPVSLITDFFVIATADNARQMRAIVDTVTERVRQETGLKPLVSEGDPASGWILADFGDVIAHVFDAERRAFYRLETMWSGGAPLGWV